MSSTAKDGKLSPDFQYLNLGDDTIMFAGNAAPTDGTSGTGAGVAGPGSIYIRNLTTPKMYINNNTKASPTWGLVTSA